jgi:hypothetical protein
MADRAKQNPDIPIRRQQRLRRWAEAIVLGIIANIVWAAILAALHLLPRSWHTWHLRWFPVNTSIWSGMLDFFTAGAPHRDRPWIGILMATITAFWLLGSYPEYRTNRRERDSDWEFYRKRAETAGRMLAQDVLLRFLCAIYLILVLGLLLFFAGTIYNMAAGHPLLTPFPKALWANYR